MSRSFQENQQMVSGVVVGAERLVTLCNLLYHLGVTSNYTGFFHTVYAVQLCVESPNRLLLVTKWVYPDVAKRYGTTWKAVERNIRTVISVIWKKNRPLLENLAYGVLAEKPCAAQFLAIVTARLLHSKGPVALDSDISASVELNQAVAFIGQDGGSQYGG